MTAIPEHHTGSNAESVAGHVCRLPVMLLDYSPTNPRKSFDERGLRELATSIQSIGLLQPVTVRPKAEGRYEVIAGERRARAHRLAKLDTIEVIVRDMTDSDVLTAQTIENLQRADLAPLEEAEGFALLLSRDEPPLTIAEVAARIGKSAGYVRSRVQLTHLVDEGRAALRKNTLSLRVAFQIARLTEADQHDILPMATKSDWSGRFPSEGQIAGEIEHRYFLDLARAPFDTKDPALVEGRPACTACPLRTGFDQNLFPDIKDKDTCTDRACFHIKRDAHVDRVVVGQMEKALSRGADPTIVARISTTYSGSFSDRNKGKSRKRHGQEKAPPLSLTDYTIVTRGENCEHTRPGVVIDGAKAGEVLRVCTDAACTTHRACGMKSPNTKDYHAQERERQKKVKRERLILRRVLDASVAALPLIQGQTLDLPDLRVVARAMLQRIWSEHIKRIAIAHDVQPVQHSSYGTSGYMSAMCAYIESLPAPAVLQLLVEIALVEEAWPSSFGVEKHSHLLALAKRVGVDVAKIRTAFNAEVRSKAKGSKTRRSKSAKSLPNQKQGEPRT